MNKKLILALLLCVAILLCSCSAAPSKGNSYNNSPGQGNSLSGAETLDSGNKCILYSRKVHYEAVPSVRSRNKGAAKSAAP